MGSRVATYVIGGLFIVGTISAYGWPSEAWYFLLVVSVPGAFLCGVQLLVDRRSLRQAHGDQGGGQGSEGGVSETGAERQPVGTAIALWREAEYIVWFLGATVAAWLVGTAISIALFTFAYIVWSFRRSGWKVALGWAAAVYVVARYGLEGWMGLPFPEGLLQYALGG